MFLPDDLGSSLYTQFIIPLRQWSWKGVYWFHLVHLSVRPSARLWTESCPLFNNTHRIHFIYTSYQATSESVLCAIIFFKSKQFEVVANSLNLQLWLCLVSTWAPIWISRMGNHGAVGVSSKRRHSSCSSYYIHTTYYSCSISNWNKFFLSDFNCRVQDSLYYDMYIGVMWHCALVSCSRSQSIGLVLGCALFWYWMSFLLIPW